MLIILYLLIEPEWQYRKPFVVTVAVIEFCLGVAYGALIF